MPFARPTLTEIIDRIVADMESRLIGVDGAVLRRSLAGIIARSEAGAVHLIYGYLDWIADQVLPDTAESEYLDRWARIWLPAGRKAATFAEGDATFTGTDGVTIASGTVWQRSDGVQFETTADGIIAGGTVTVNSIALSAGLTGNTDAGATGSLLSPIISVDNTVTVAAGGIAGGTDQESDDDLRARLTQRIQNPPHGGSKSDYEAWALEVAGVTRAWVNPLGMGDGTVVVLFVRDDDPSIFPDAGEIATVQAYIDERRPVTAEVFVDSPGQQTVDMTIQISPNTTAVQEAVTSELEDLFLRQAAPGGTMYISKIREAVSIAAGEDNNVVVTPAADVVAGAGDLLVLGTITYQDIP